MLSGIFKPKFSSSAYPEETINILRLIRSENVGNRTFFDLIKIFGTATNAISHIQEMSMQGGRKKPIKLCSLDSASHELKLASSIGAKFITYQDDLYPKLLLHIPDNPPVINALGRVELLNQPTIAIVGARNCSVAGMQLAAQFAREISDAGVAIVSGFARGIDTAAHKASLEKGTIAVLAGGIDHIYPQENKDLYHQIAKQGCIVAELAVGSSPSSQHFPQRNRIISGLSLATVVIEASIGSGSLITANLAVDHGREVFAVPGFPADPRYRGNNKLLKQGALIAESASDILNNLPNFEMKALSTLAEDKIRPYRNEQINTTNIGADARKIVTNLLSSSPIHIDTLVSYSHMPISVVQFVILELELAGKITRHPGNKISMIYGLEL